MLVHTFWILGYPGETFEEMNETINFALSTGADSFSFAILSPLPGTPIYRKVVKENLWWDGKSLNDLMFRSSLVKVDGFTGPDEFEEFVNNTNKKANLILKEKDQQDLCTNMVKMPMKNLLLNKLNLYNCKIN